MNYESDAKVVRGLSVATIVLSVLGILASIALIAGAGVVTSTVINEYEGNGGSIEELFDLDEDASDVYEDFGQMIDALDEQTTADFAQLFGTAKVSEINAFGKVVQTTDKAQIKKALAAFDDKYDLDLDEAKMAKFLTSFSKGTTIAIGSELADLGKDDLQDLASALAKISTSNAYGLHEKHESHEQHNTFGDTSLSSGEELAAQLFAGVLIALIVLATAVYVVSLIAAILSLRNCRKPDKLTGAFVWSIIAAVLSCLACHLITTVLLIISCVYISKVRKFRELPQGAASASEASPVQPAGQPPIPPQE